MNYPEHDFDRFFISFSVFENFEKPIGVKQFKLLPK